MRADQRSTFDVHFQIYGHRLDSSVHTACAASVFAQSSTTAVARVNCPQCLEWLSVARVRHPSSCGAVDVDANGTPV